MGKKYKKPTEVSRFLEVNPFLIPLLREAYTHIRKYFLSSKLILAAAAFLSSMAWLAVQESWRARQGRAAWFRLQFARYLGQGADSFPWWSGAAGAACGESGRCRAFSWLAAT